MTRTGSPDRSPLVALAGAALLAAPVLVGVAYSVLASVGVAGAGSGGAAATLPLLGALADPVTWRGLAWSLWVAAASTLLALAGAVLVLAAFDRGGRADRLARALAAASLPVPHLVAGALGVWILGQSGVLARIAVALGLATTPAELPALLYDAPGIGTILAFAWKECAFFTVVGAALLAGRGRQAEEAARTLGADRGTAFRLVTWPLLRRGLMPSVLAAFVFVLGNYEVTALLAPSDPRALPLLVAERGADATLARRGEAYALTLLLLGVAAVVVVAHERVRARWERLDG